MKVMTNLMKVMINGMRQTGQADNRTGILSHAAGTPHTCASYTAALEMQSNSAGCAVLQMCQHESCCIIAMPAGKMTSLLDD